MLSKPSRRGYPTRGRNWPKITAFDIAKYTSNIKERCEAVIATEGGHTNCEYSEKFADLFVLYIDDCNILLIRLKFWWLTSGGGHSVRE